MALHNYVIMFTPRSGSSWLTAILSATGRLGHPEEYLNPAFLPELLQRMECDNTELLLERLIGSTATDNGVFGIEVTSLHVAHHDRDAFFYRFGEDGSHPAAFFLLWRANIVAQGISLYRAVASGRFHSWEPDRPPPADDPEQICVWIQHLMEIENENLAMLQQRRITPRVLLYETMTRAPRQVCQSFADAMGLRLAGAVPSRAPTKMGDDWNRRTEESFRARYHDFIAGIEAGRAMRRLAPRAA